MIRASVVLAAYNGEKYIVQQIKSIISQLSDVDEIIVSCDPSTDNTQGILKEMAQADKRITIVEGKGNGVVQNFNNGLDYVNGEYIFLSDQDDVWQPGKLNKCLAALDDSIAVIHNFTPVDENLVILGESFLDKGFNSSFISNWIKNKYIGCCMAFKKELLDECLPFPQKIPMHDQWIGIIANRVGKVTYIKEKLLLYRRHNNTVTGNKVNSVFKIISMRLSFLVIYIKYFFKQKGVL